MDERKLKDALKACLSKADFPPERQQAVLRAFRKDEKVVKRKISVAMVFVIVMMLIVGGAAIAAGLGVFGQSVNDQQNEQSAVRLEKLEDVSVDVDNTQTVQAPSAPDAAAQPQTVRDTMLKNLYGRSFHLTLNQSHYDGRKLYYSYTLTTNAPLAWYEGEGMPSGFDSWDMQAEGQYADNYTQYFEADQERYVAFFASHPVGYIGKESMGLGDGAEMNGQPLMILDSGETVVDDFTVQGFQEVEMPEGFTPEGDIEIELSIMYGASLYYQDGNNVYWAHIATPENRGIFRLPFTVTPNGEAETMTGAISNSVYSATATVILSEVDISGEVIFDAPEWAAALTNTSAANINGDSADTPAYIFDYMLIAGDEAYPNQDGSFGVNADGQFFVGIRYDLPADTSDMRLRPTTSGISSTQDAQLESEEIVLMK